MAHAALKVTVGNGDIKIGDTIAWVTKYDGVRTGVVDLIAQSQRYGGFRTKIRAIPNRKEGGYYQSPQTLFKIRNVIKLSDGTAPQGVSPQTTGL
jgi:hypothetical protein